MCKLWFATSSFYRIRVLILVFFDAFAPDADTHLVFACK